LVDIKRTCHSLLLPPHVLISRNSRWRNTDLDLLASDVSVDWWVWLSSGSGNGRDYLSTRRRAGVLHGKLGRRVKVGT
jgi:hypothetical protein